MVSASRRVVRRVGFSVALLISIAGCRPAAPEVGRPRLVILYATCSLNRAFLSPYNPEITFTPNLAALARRGVVFRAHQTESGISGVSYASLFSGTQALRHGVFSHPTLLPDSAWLATEAFAEAGYDVRFWADHMMAAPILNYAQGVDPENIFEPPVLRLGPDVLQQRPEVEAFLKGDDPRFVEVLETLRDDPQSRAFLQTNFTVTHGPYSAAYLTEFCGAHPDECRELAQAEVDRYSTLFWTHYMDLSWRFGRTVERLELTAADVDRLARVVELLYKANVYRLDALFGQLLAAIDEYGLADETLIAFTADHGEILYRENAIFPWTHGFALAPEVLGVPWILMSPGVEPGAYDRVTRSVDVFPTIAGLAGLRFAADESTGVDLRAALTGREPPPELRAFSHTAIVPAILLRDSRKRGGTRLDALHPLHDADGLWVAVREGELVHKLTRGPDGSFRSSVFDLADDPTETTDLYDETNPEHRRVAADLAAYRDALSARYADAPEPGSISAERTLEMLRGLGYVE
jgi:arylsulfatase A-like enzyme